MTCTSCHSYQTREDIVILNLPVKPSFDLSIHAFCNDEKDSKVEDYECSQCK